MDCAVITVHTMNPVHHKGPVYYASLPCGSSADETCASQGAKGEEAKQHLVSALWDQCVTMEHPLRNGCPFPVRTDSPLQVLRGTLGRPRLMVGAHPGPAISFSEGGGTLWAALCFDESAIGIDAAGSDEFQEAYPVQRVFHAEELDHALGLTSGDRGAAAALLWSIKEAVVKALGCGFHLVDPRDITVCPAAGAAGQSGGHSFLAGLSGKALARFPRCDRSLWVHALPGRRMWLSIALMNRKPVRHD